LRRLTFWGLWNWETI